MSSWWQNQIIPGTFWCGSWKYRSFNLSYNQKKVRSSKISLTIVPLMLSLNISLSSPVFHCVAPSHHSSWTFSYFFFPLDLPKFLGTTLMPQPQPLKTHCLIHFAHKATIVRAKFVSYESCLIWRKKPQYDREEPFWEDGVAQEQ